MALLTPQRIERAALARSLAIGIGLILLALSTIHFFPPGMWGDDWATYRAGVHRLFSGGSLYAPFQLAGPYPLRAAAGGFGFVYPPSSVPMVAPVALSGSIGRAVWFALGPALYLSGVAAVLRRETGSLHALWIVPFALAAGPWFPQALASGNATLLLAGFLAWAWAVPRTAGAIAGLGLAIKLAMGAIVVWAWRERGWRAVAIGALVPRSSRSSARC